MKISKVCLLGDPAVGKTSLIIRFVQGVFRGNYLATIGANIYRKDVRTEKGTVVLTLWDIAGHLKYNQLTPSFYNGSEAAIIVGDITRKETLLSIPYWYDMFRKYTSGAAIMAINKTDLKHMVDISDEDVRRMARELNMEYVYTSALTGEGVNTLFQRVAELVL